MRGEEEGVAREKQQLTNTIMAHPDLGQLLEDPDRIVAIPASEIPRLIGDAEALKARLWARLQECSAPVAAVAPSQSGNRSHRVLTASQPAERLDVTQARLYELARTGTLPAVRIGRQLSFSPEVLSGWIEAGNHLNRKERRRARQALQRGGEANRYFVHPRVASWYW